MSAVSYEVTVRLRDAADSLRFQGWMRSRHIPDVLATGAFEAAEFAGLSPTVFRTRYRAASRAALDDYLAEHTGRLRADFEREFGNTATTIREVWAVFERWPATG